MISLRTFLPVAMYSSCACSLLRPVGWIAGKLEVSIDAKNNQSEHTDHSVTFPGEPTVPFCFATEIEQARPCWRSRKEDVRLFWFTSLWTVRNCRIITDVHISYGGLLIQSVELQGIRMAWLTGQDLSYVGGDAIEFLDDHMAKFGKVLEFGRFLHLSSRSNLPRFRSSLNAVGRRSVFFSNRWNRSDLEKFGNS